MRLSGGSDRVAVRHPGVPVHRGRAQLVHHQSSGRADRQAVRLPAGAVPRRPAADGSSLLQPCGHATELLLDNTQYRWNIG